MRRLFILHFATAVATVAMVSSVFAYCSKPDAPSCATRYGAFDDQDDFDRCKREMASYKDEVESYLSCLNRDGNSAKSDYSDAVDSFNRRARY